MFRLCESKKTDRRFYFGQGNGLVGSIRAYYDPNYPTIFLYEYDESLNEYSETVHKLLEYLQQIFPNYRATAAMCENDCRIYSRSSALPEYGFRFSDNTFSYFVRVNKTCEFNITAYNESEVCNG